MLSVPLRVYFFCKKHMQSEIPFIIVADINGATKLCSFYVRTSSRGSIVSMWYQ